MRKISKIAAILLVGAFLVSVSASVYAQNVWVYVDRPGLGTQGAWVDTEWIGEIPIIVGNQAPDGESTIGYCLNPEYNLIGGGYQASLTSVPDNSTWRAISYILTWYNPANSSTQAVTNQLAIWKCLDKPWPSWVPAEYYQAADLLWNFAKNKDVARQDDYLSWVAPIEIVNTGNAMVATPGQVITFTAKLSALNGTGRANVAIFFSVSGVDGAVLSSTQEFTDNQGLVSTTLTIPNSVPQGASIQIEASTYGVWPKLYLDLDGDPQPQDLVGIGTKFGLTVTAHPCIVGNILFTVPEVPLGTLAAAGACVAGYVVWKKKAHPNKQKMVNAA